MPTSLKVFLTALAIIDDLGAVVIIAVFYTGELSCRISASPPRCWPSLAALNRFGVTRLCALPAARRRALVLRAALGRARHHRRGGARLHHPAPRRARAARTTWRGSPLHRLEHGLHNWVAFGVVPVFGFANAGVSFAGLTADVLLDHLTLGVALGLFLGKLVGVFGSAALAIRAGPRRPADGGELAAAGWASPCSAASASP